MAGKSDKAKPETAAPTSGEKPVVQDVNFNGKLDGTDLARAMVAEEQEGSRRVASERAHGFLDIAGAREAVLAWNIAATAGIDLNALKVGTARAMNESLTVELALYKRDPKGYIAGIKEHPPEQYRGKPELLAADIASFEAFAKTFEQKFKGGIDIKPEEVLGVIGHFGPVFMPANGSNPPSPGQTPRVPDDLLRGGQRI